MMRTMPVMVVGTGTVVMEEESKYGIYCTRVLCYNILIPTKL